MELDFSRQLHYVWALLPEIVLCTFAMIVLVAGVSGKNRQKKGESSTPDFGAGAELGWLALVGLLIAAFFNGWLYGVTEVGSASMVAVDRFRGTRFEPSGPTTNPDIPYAGSVLDYVARYLELHFVD